jgi:hypothetical protein
MLRVVNGCTEGQFPRVLRAVLVCSYDVIGTVAITAAPLRIRRVCPSRAVARMTAGPSGFRYPAVEPLLQSVHQAETERVDPMSPQGQPPGFKIIGGAKSSPCGRPGGRDVPAPRQTALSAAADSDLGGFSPKMSQIAQRRFGLSAIYLA